MATGKLTLEEAADRFIAKQVMAELPNRDELHRRTVQHLIQSEGCSLRLARYEAAKAIANHEAKETDARVDIAQSTSTCVFLNVDGNPHALSVRDLLGTLDARQLQA